MQSMASKEKNQPAAKHSLQGDFCVFFPARYKPFGFIKD
jgi:hypothetical protein